MEKQQPLLVRVATLADGEFAEMISEEMAASAKARGTGIAHRTPEYLRMKMGEGKAVIAFVDEAWAGFCYIEAWGHDQFVANSGLIVNPRFRGLGAARAIKHKIFELSRQKYPEAKIFGLTTGLAVMKINSELGYEPVTYSELTDDEQFWKGCQSCVNFDILTAKNRKNCICTSMLYDPAIIQKEAQEPVENTFTQTQVFKIKHTSIRKKKRSSKHHFNWYEQWIGFKKYISVKNKERESEQ